MAADAFDAIGRAIKGAAAIFALLPGVALLSGAVALPPSLATTIKGLVLACGVVVILLVVGAKKQLYAMPLRSFILMVATAAVLGSMMAIYHLNFADDHLLLLSGREMVALPTSPSPQLQALLSDFAGDYAEAVTNPTAGPEVLRLIEEENDSANVIIVSTLVGAQLLITFAIVAAAWRVSHHGD